MPLFLYMPRAVPRVEMDSCWDTDLTEKEKKKPDF
jgi:hypothetical protein